jgi:integrase
MKRDIFNHEGYFNSWKENITPKYIEKGLTEENSKLFIEYMLDMESGNNVSKYSRKGGRDIKTLNRVRNKVKQILKMLQEAGIKDVSKIKEKELRDFFNEWNKTHSSDYAKRFKAFWNWWMLKNRKEGVVVLDVAEQISTSNGNNESIFVWIDKNRLDKFIKYFNPTEQVALLFCFDSLIRSPTELLSLKRENIFEKNGEVWIDIPNNISKTFGRKFNLLYSGSALLKHIKDKNSNEYIFDFNSSVLNRKMQRIAKQLWKDEVSEGGEKFCKITMYDLRHSGTIHLRQLFQKTGQSLDILRERGGWTDFKMINYYTKRLGLDGYINKEKTLLQEDKTQLEKKLSETRKFSCLIAESMAMAVEQKNPKLLKMMAEKLRENIKKIKSNN